MGFENSGRRPQPTALKMLRGNPGKRKPNPHEPQPPKGEAAMPVELSQAARKVWAELAPICQAMGTLTVADVRPFATLCELQATLAAASAQKDAEGFAPFTVADDFNGVATVKVHAALKLERETAQAVRPYYALFGLEPVSRARIAVAKPAEESESKWTGVLR